MSCSACASDIPELAVKMFARQTGAHGTPCSVRLGLGRIAALHVLVHRACSVQHYVLCAEMCCIQEYSGNRCTIALLCVHSPMLLYDIVKLVARFLCVTFSHAECQGW